MADEREPFGDVSSAVRVHVPIDDPWRKACKTRLKAMGYKQGDLAAHIGCSQSNISQTLSVEADPPQQTSEYAHAISLALSVPLPPSARMALMSEMVRQKVPDSFEGVAGAFEAIRGLPAIKPGSSRS